jgi:hypothetical protein
MTVGEWRVHRICPPIMPDPKHVADFVRDREHKHCTRMMHHEIGLGRFCADSGRKTAARWVIDYQTNDISPRIVPQLPDVAEATDPIHHRIQVSKVIALPFLVLHQLGSDQPEANVLKSAISE